MSDLPTRLRKWCSTIRRTPAPIVEVVRLAQQAADEIERLQAAIDAAVEKEREQCADLCERLMLSSVRPYTPADCAAFIRARAKQS